MTRSNTNRVLRIATRGSALAMWQAHHVAKLLRKFPSAVDVEIIEVSTQGDRDRATALATMGGQGVFTREVQAAVLDMRADIAVHSLKDLPTESTPGLILAAVPERGGVNDALILPASHQAQSSDGRTILNSLRSGATIGTGSLRRQAQLLNLRPDLRLVENRGNVETRLRKLDEGHFDAIVLAEAGLTRLGLEMRISAVLEAPWFLPAVGQGALGIECRADDQETRDVLSSLVDPKVFSAVVAERSLLAALRAGCHAPVGVSCQLNTNGRLQLTAAVLSVDGKERIAADATGVLRDAASIGVSLANSLRCLGAYRLLNS